MASSAEEQWELAQKWRREILKESEHIKEGKSDGSEIARFEKADSYMAYYRLACVQAILSDISLAAKNGIETDLWQTHSQLNTLYRKVLHRLGAADKVAVARKVEKAYRNYIKVAQEFYRAYIERLYARYHITELHPVFIGLHLKQMELPPESVVDAQAAGVTSDVISSCHHTLICLGDLARYRTLQRPVKDRRWDNSLTYYSLSIALSPESGIGHHQIGLVHLEVRDYFHVVYHLYRSMACDKPYGLAQGNLNRAFKEALKPSDTPATLTDKDNLRNWFVKLLGRFSKQEELKSYDEMEEEVLHRFSRALRIVDDADLQDMLRIMILTNISAYHVAAKQARDKWSEKASLVSQIILRWNIRSINAIASVLRAELTEYMNTIGNKGSAEPCGKFSATVDSVMSLFRIYMAWLCTYTSNLVDFQPHLEPYFGDMAKTLAQALTLALEMVYGVFDPATSFTLPFLLPEDEASLGLACLNGPDLKAVCRLNYNHTQNTDKIRRQDYDKEYTDEQLMFTRAAHIVYCTLTLTGDNKFPLVISMSVKDSKTQSVVAYLENGKAQPTTPLEAQPGANTPVPTMQPTSETATYQDQSETPSSLETESMITPLPSTVGSSDLPTAPEPFTEDQPMESQVYSMLSDFLAPPESPKTTISPQFPTAHQSGTEEGTGYVPSNPTAPTTPPTEAVRKPLYNALPWGFFNVPNPYATPVYVGPQHPGFMVPPHAAPVGYYGPAPPPGYPMLVPPGFVGVMPFQPAHAWNANPFLPLPPHLAFAYGHQHGAGGAEASVLTEPVEQPQQQEQRIQNEARQPKTPQPETRHQPSLSGLTAATRTVSGPIRRMKASDRLDLLASSPETLNRKQRQAQISSKSMSHLDGRSLFNPGRSSPTRPARGGRGGQVFVPAGETSDSPVYRSDDKIHLPLRPAKMVDLESGQRSSPIRAISSTPIFFPTRGSGRHAGGGSGRTEKNDEPRRRHADASRGAYGTLDNANAALENEVSAHATNRSIGDQGASQGAKAAVAGKNASAQPGAEPPVRNQSPKTFRPKKNEHAER